MDPTVHNGHTLGATLGGYILDCTHVRGLVPSLITGHGRDLHLGSQTVMAYGSLAQGTVHEGHILLGEP